MYSNQILVVANEGPPASLPKLLENCAPTYQIISCNSQREAEDFCRCILPVTVICDASLLLNPLQFLQLIFAASHHGLFPDVFLYGEAGGDLDDLFPGQYIFWLAADTEPIVVQQLILMSLRQQELKQRKHQQGQELRYLSLIDPITSQKNALYLSEFLELESRQCLRYGYPLAVVVGRLDRDDEVFNTLGSDAAQQMLAALAQFIARRKRQGDILARMSGPEMVLVLPHTDADGAMEMADRIRKQLAQSSFTLSPAQVSASSSFGLCQYRVDMETNWQLLLDYARAALRQCRDGAGNACLLAE